MSCSDIPEYDLTIYQGDDKTFYFRHMARTVPVDLDGYTITFECASLPLSKTAVIADQAITPGEYSFVFVPADTQLTTHSRVRYEVVFWPNGLGDIKNTKFGGTLKIVQEVA